MGSQRTNQQTSQRTSQQTSQRRSQLISRRTSQRTSPLANQLEAPKNQLEPPKNQEHQEQVDHRACTPSAISPSPCSSWANTSCKKIFGRGHLHKEVINSE